MSVLLLAEGLVRLLVIVSVGDEDPEAVLELKIPDGKIWVELPAAEEKSEVRNRFLEVLSEFPRKFRESFILNWSYFELYSLVILEQE